MFVPLPTPADAGICSPIDSLRASLPTSSVEFRTANLALFIAYTLLFSVISIPPLYYWRKHPRFAKLRPFWVLCFMCACGILAATMTFLRLAFEDTFPCALTVVIYLMCPYGLETVLVFRVLLYVIESEVQSKLRGRQLEFDDESVDLTPPSASAVKEILGVAFGLQDLNSVHVDNLVQAKRPGFMIAITLLAGVFRVIAIIVFFAVYPSLLYCVGCYPFNELLIAVVCCSGAGALIIGRIAYVGYKHHLARDKQGVIFELGIVTVFVLPLVILSYILEMIDPNNVDKDYNFAFEWLTMGGGTIFYFACIPMQLWAVYRQNQRSKKVLASASELHGDDIISEKRMLAVILSEINPFYKEFESFVMRNLVLELVNFLRDVTAFKNYFQEKGDNWRMQKTKLLVSNYIQIGATAEVNVSDITRRRILDRIKQIEVQRESNSGLRTVFDEAYSEVVQLLLHGVWMRFALNKAIPHFPAKETTLSAFDSRVAPSNDSASSV